MSPFYRIPLLVIAFIVANLTAQAQLYNLDYDDEMKYKLSVRYGAIHTGGVDRDSINDASGIYLSFFEIEKVSHVDGYQHSHRWGFLAASLSLLAFDMINGGDVEWGSKSTSTELGDFILGWHSHAWALLDGDNQVLSLGVHYGDYFTGYEPYSASNNGYGNAREPAGWYGALGPVVMHDLLLTPGMALHSEASYALTSKFSDYEDMHFDRDYPKPHFIKLSAQLRGNSIFYGGMEHIRMVNRGDNPVRISRTDLVVGIWL